MTLQEWIRKLRRLEQAQQAARAKVGPWVGPAHRDAVYAAARAAEDAVREHHAIKPNGWGS